MRRSRYIDTSLVERRVLLGLVRVTESGEGSLWFCYKHRLSG